MSAIKLFHVSTTENGVKRFHTQLDVFRNSDSCSFIMEDGKMKSWGYSENGVVGFYDYNKPYIIVDNINDMKEQEL